MTPRCSGTVLQTMRADISLTLAMMDGFRKNYGLYSSLLSMTALWPYDHTLGAKIQRISFIILSFSLVVIQISSIRTVEVSLYNILLTMSYTCPLLLYIQRYIYFLSIFPLLKVIFGNIGKICRQAKNSVELDLFMKHIIDTRRIIVAYLATSCITACFTLLVIGIPTILRSNLQLYYLRMFGFFYNQGGQQTDIVCLLLILVNAMGVMSIAGTEAAIGVNVSYLCGLLEVTSYRLDIAVNDMINSATMSQINIRPAVAAHQRALQMTKTVTNRLLLAIKDMTDAENVFFSASFVALHFINMFLNNHSGQRLRDTGNEIFHRTYNSLWYCIPPRSQKIILFILMKSTDIIEFDLAGLYTPCYEGFSMMLSSSFSYFTVLYSTTQ
ncbi:uncharacterized protein LOC117217624 isoform X2 [Megalopta genalis]|uniref:uncharacterized protein LOC117217624 isoform X2 n=1 Tax=Megalopta genalis TaxID=115081 RepID=UPI003FCFB8EA